jgi:NAD(P)-dependent dehydrogenase (short-subunit alcohol dehydrogenase family)
LSGENGGLLAGKVVVVTGAARGLGRAYASHAAAAGARVVVNDVDAGEAATVAAELAALGHDAVPSGHDISDAGAVEELMALAESELGPLGGLVNNAGLYYEAVPWTDDAARIRALVEVNVLGTLFCTTSAARRFAAAGRGGSIVNASSGALFGFPAMAAYAASKGAVASLTYAAAFDLAEIGVRINAIAPIAATRLTLAARSGHRHVPEGASAAPLTGIEERTPDRIAPLVTFLLSSLADGISGELIRFDGTRLSRLRRGDPSGHPAVKHEHWDVASVAEAFAGPLATES